MSCGVVPEAAYAAAPEASAPVRTASMYPPFWVCMVWPVPATLTSGRFSVVFRLMNGTEHNPTGIYQDVIPEKKLVFTWELPGAKEPRTLVTFRLTPFDGGTELTLTHEHLPDTTARDSHERGWIGLLDKLPIFLGVPV